MTLLTRGHERDSLNFWAYMTVFPLAVWLLIFSKILLMSLYFNFSSSMSRSESSQSVSLKEGISLSYALFLQGNLKQIAEKATKLASKKIAFFSVNVGFLFLFIAYSSDLTSFLTVATTSEKNRNFEVLV